LADIRKTYPNITPSVLVAEMIRDMIGMMVVDVLDTSMENIERLNPQSSKDVSNAGQQIVCFSAEMDRKMSELRQFLFERMYRRYSVERITLKVKRILPDLFNAFLNQYRLLPDHWQRRVEVAGGVDNREARARVVCDYIAGMTDRFAIREHERMFDLYWDLK